MAFTIGGKPVPWDIAKFEKLASDKGVTWKRSSLKDLRKHLKDKKTIKTQLSITTEINKIPHNKRMKYKKVLKYLAFHWPNLITAPVNVLQDGRLGNRLNFKQYYATMDPNTEFVDLLYGLSFPRMYAAYKLDTGRLRQADDFNNSTNIGTGIAFDRTWGGFAATPGKGKGFVTSAQTRSEVLKFRGKNVQKIREEVLSVYAHGLLGTRYSPTTVHDLPHEKLYKDRQKLQKDVQDKSEAHYWAHARFVKAVRRACKGGIAMVASSPLYRQADAKIHFILDGLGDMGKMARKDPVEGDWQRGDAYVAITTTEICFCCRYWNDPEFPLSTVVKFYMNGERVNAPWEADWRINCTGNGEDTYSNQEAWHRYNLSRDWVDAKKPFPKFTDGQTMPDEDE